MIFSFLANNALTGPIPSEIGFLTTLTSLYLRKSLLSFNEKPCLHLTASFLIVLSGSNALAGSIPSQLGQLKNAVIDFNYNNFTNCEDFKAQHPSHVENSYYCL
jgi:hypothetical protein